MIAARATAVVVAALLATACSTQSGVPSATPAAPSLAPVTPAPPSLTPVTPASPSLAEASPSTPPLPVGNLDAGATYALDGEGGQRILVTVPAVGWLSVDTWFLGKNDTGADLFSMTLLPYTVSNVYADPCRWMAGTVDPPVGPTVDDLAAVLVKQEGPDAPAPTDVTIDGYAGKKVELSIPDDVDIDTCHEGDFGRWQPTVDPEHYGPFTYGNGQHDTVYIVDVDGTRWVIDTNYLPGTPTASLAELEQLVASIRFER